MLKKLEFTGLFNESSYTTKYITNRVILNILYYFLLHKLSHFVTIAFISKKYQVQNKPMDFYLLNKRKDNNHENRTRRIQSSNQQH